MSFYIERIQELGLLIPKQREKQRSYVKRLLLSGYRLDTRQCRYIGIGNLHSIVSELTRKKFPHTVEHQKVKDPYTGEIPPYYVDVVWMTVEQREAYQTQKATEKNPIAL